jgi:phosphoglycerate dehydrogenase-like enzyme
VSGECRLEPTHGVCTKQTGARQFALMQPHAFFITTARGFIEFFGRF